MNNLGGYALSVKAQMPLFFFDHAGMENASRKTLAENLAKLMHLDDPDKRNHLKQDAPFQVLLAGFCREIPP